MKRLPHRITLSTCIVLSSILVLTGCSVIGGSDKPSKDALVKHTIELLKKDSVAAITKEDEVLITEALNCVYESVYDDLSTDTLNSIMDTKDNEDYSTLEEDLTKKEKQAFDKAEKDCESILKQTN